MGESALDGALREAAEEAAVPREALVLKGTYLLDLQHWTYTTVVAEVVTPFEPRIEDEESLALRWVEVGEVADRELHPGFASAWGTLRRLLETRSVLLIDVANVLGARPDGWWRDRPGATERLLSAIEARANAGVPAADLGIDGHSVIPRVVAVVEGAAKQVEHTGRVETVRAPRDGDSEIVAQAELLSQEGWSVTVASSDRGLVSRLPRGVRAQGAGWLRGLLEA